LARSFATEEQEEEKEGESEAGASMIPVAFQPEPASFDAKVRKPGLRWLKANQIPLKNKLPPKTTLKPVWRASLDDLHTAYGGICAYLCIFIERCTGGSSVDHYVAKSQIAGRAYDWDNYRLACTTMNARKRDYATVLDPFLLTPDTFHLELVTGRIFPNPARPSAEQTKARQTIDRLGLDDGACREMRARRFGEYLELRGSHKDPAVVENWLLRYSPFIHAEAERQGSL
jgi:uncharacterized protein (TIGR02646 family)